ncbi:MAG: TetR/AcrR family transcriptional regulator [Phycisphaerales bacterium]|jgi:AcrR family transcriptional regulator|nr:TetR/AcrR family transcriptional regulator [Phycisphaerales bacterium]
MLELVNEGGMPAAASVRSIARRASVTEAVLYRYFPTKDAMLREVWETTLAPMVKQKRDLLAVPSESPAKVLGDWIQITYEQFDRDPAAFHFVFLSEGTADWRDDPIYRVQGDLLGTWMASAFDAKQIAPLSHSRALHCFVDLLLGVPRGIRFGDLPGPATAHVEETLAASARVLGF